MTDPALLALFTPIARGVTEAVVFAFLDTGGRVLALRHCTAKSFDTIEVPLRVIAADALAFDARQVVMAHNHPSGDPEPSRRDVIVTRRIATALDALGVRLVDHFVLAGDAVFSFRNRGLL